MLYANLCQFFYLCYQVLLPDGKAVVKHAVQQPLFSTIGRPFQLCLHHN